LAWHDGNGRKLGNDFMISWHLNRESSYLVSYLVQSLAFTKWMQGCFSKTLVAGLSQAGAAALLNALQSKPNQAIVAAGHSVITDQAEWSGHNQLIGVPGYAEISRPEVLVDRLRQSPTRWFFSWGKQEIGTYRIESEEQLTAKVISHLPKVTTVFHDEGHVYPVQEIRSFLANSSSHSSTCDTN